MALIQGLRTIYLFHVALSCLCSVCLLSGCSPTSTDSSVIRREGEPDVMSVDSKDAEMNAAIKQAQQTSTNFLSVLVAPKTNQTDFSVKRPYTTKDGKSVEHIWISEVSYDGKLLHGKIGDEPVNIPDLKLNDPVSFPPSEISDWIYLDDGKIVGGYTIRILRKHMSAQDAAEFDQHLQFK
jgi:uncharacterized protein YegJ (DUF2314 family)